MYLLQTGGVFFQVQFRIFTPLLLLSHVACFSGWQEGGGEELTTCVPIITLTTVLVHLTRSPLLCLLSVFILLHPVSTPVWVSSACCLQLGCSGQESCRHDAHNPPAPSLREVYPANSPVKEEQRLKHSSLSFIEPYKPTALPSGTSVQEIPLLEHRLFGDRVEGKKEKT